MTRTLLLRSLLVMGASTAALLASAPAFAQESQGGAQGATGGVGVAPAASPAGQTGQGAAAPVTSGAPAPPASAGSPRAAPAGGGGNVIEELIVTAQKREESIQNVPIAVSAFSSNSLKAARVEGGQNLVLQVPNVNFSRGNFGGFNFSIRGIGSKLVAAGADAATGIHENNVPLTYNTLADTDFYDVERVEVLRGPQGTLFGRNSTGGLVNIVTAKPNDRYSSSATAEFGNFDTKRFKGYFNVPLGDTLSLRVAGFHVDRGGFGKNLVTGNDIDGRDINSTRISLRWKPVERLTADFMWEHFDEGDNRSRVGKQFCIKDPGPTSVGGVKTNAATQGFLSQGCLPGNLYANGLQETNTSATLGGLIGNLVGLTAGDAYAGKVQDPNLYNIEAAVDPVYKTRQDTYILNLQYNLTDNLQLTSLTSYNTYRQFTTADYNRATPTQTFLTPIFQVPGVGAVPATVAFPAYFKAGGFFADPQVGYSNQFRTFDETTADNYQSTEEIRLQSSFKGPINFNAGAIFLNFDNQTNYYVLGNTLTAAAVTSAFSPNNYVDTSNPPTGEGHNYYDNRSRYSLRSRAAFGELYYQITDDIKLTAGYRYTDDRKKNALFPVPLLAPGRGLVSTGNQYVTFKESTGRFNAQWTPHLSFTDQTTIYASYSRGYKGGGFNPPGSIGVAGIAEQYAPEFIDAFEVGTKNTLLNGSLVLNLTGFYYNYSGYQVSQIINRTSVNTNIDASIYGGEFEGIWEPIRKLRFNTNIGLLHTEIKNATQIDVANRTQGDPSLTLVKASNAANCVAPTAGVAGIQGLINAGVLQSTALLGICSGAFSGAANPLAALGISATPSEGKLVNLQGNQLPNAPKITASVGAQYVYEMPGQWTATPRVDFYYQGATFSRIFNTEPDKLKSYINLNATLAFTKADWGLDVQFFVKNLTDERVITDIYLTDDSSGLFSNIFLNEPRQYGVSLTKSF